MEVGWAFVDMGTEPRDMNPRIDKQNIQRSNSKYHNRHTRHYVISRKHDIYTRDRVSPINIEPTNKINYNILREINGNYANIACTYLDTLRVYIWEIKVINSLN